jgi:hypothetical protein
MASRTTAEGILEIDAALGANRTRAVKTSAM